MFFLGKFLENRTCQFFYSCIAAFIVSSCAPAFEQNPETLAGEKMTAEDKQTESSVGASGVSSCGSIVPDTVAPNAIKVLVCATSSNSEATGNHFYFTPTPVWENSLTQAEGEPNYFFNHADSYTVFYKVFLSGLFDVGNKDVDKLTQAYQVLHSLTYDQENLVKRSAGRNNFFVVDTPVPEKIYVYDLTKVRLKVTTYGQEGMSSAIAAINSSEARLAMTFLNPQGTPTTIPEVPKGVLQKIMGAVEFVSIAGWIVNMVFELANASAQYMEHFYFGAPIAVCEINNQMTADRGVLVLSGGGLINPEKPELGRRPYACEYQVLLEEIAKTGLASYKAEMSENYNAFKKTGSQFLIDRGIGYNYVSTKNKGLFAFHRNTSEVKPIVVTGGSVVEKKIESLLTFPQDVRLAGTEFVKELVFVEYKKKDALGAFTKDGFDIVATTFQPKDPRCPTCTDTYRSKILRELNPSEGLGLRTMDFDSNSQLGLLNIRDANQNFKRIFDKELYNVSSVKGFDELFDKLRCKTSDKDPYCGVVLYEKTTNDKGEIVDDPNNLVEFAGSNQHGLLAIKHQKDLSADRWNVSVTPLLPSEIKEAGLPILKSTSVPGVYKGYIVAGGHLYFMHIEGSRLVEAVDPFANENDLLVNGILNGANMNDKLNPNYQEVLLVATNKGLLIQNEKRKDPVVFAVKANGVTYTNITKVSSLAKSTDGNVTVKLMLQAVNPDTGKTQLVSAVLNYSLLFDAVDENTGFYLTYADRAGEALVDGPLAVSLGINSEASPIISSSANMQDTPEGEVFYDIASKERTFIDFNDVLVGELVNPASLPIATP